MGAEIQEVQSWREFLEIIESLRKAHSGSMSPLLFRGQENSEWPLRTTLERQAPRIRTFEEYYRLIYRIKNEIESFTDDEWDVPRKQWNYFREYDECSRDLSVGQFPAPEYSGFLRHHGFPSPLLDWTKSPYIAAFFAFHAKGSAPRSIYVYADAPNNLKMHSSDRANIFVLGPRVGSHRRHFLQQSTYTTCMKFQSNEWIFGEYAEVFERTPSLGNLTGTTGPIQDVLWKFVLPSSEREGVLRGFDEHNLNAYSLFGSVESLMATMSVREIELARPTTVEAPQQPGASTATQDTPL